jgi:hypothetical protein
VRDVELRFTAPLAERAERILAAGDSINDLFRNEWQASGNLFSRARNQAGSAEVFVGFLRLGGKYFVLLSRKDSDLALIGPFKPNVHDTGLSVVNLSAMADGNYGDRSGVLDKDNPPIANSKPATLGAFEPSYIARSFVGVARQFGVDALANINRKPEPLTGCGRREQDRLHLDYFAHLHYRDKRYIA